MSEMEFHTGRVTKICRSKEGFRAKVTAAIALYDLSVDEDDISYEEEWLYTDGFAYFGGDLWKVEDTKHEEYLSKATKVTANTFEYILHYYNGGAGFEEVLEEAIKEA